MILKNGKNSKKICIIKILSFKLLFKRRGDDGCAADSSVAVLSPASFIVVDDDDSSYGRILLEITREGNLICLTL